MWTDHRTVENAREQSKHAWRKIRWKWRKIRYACRKIRWKITENGDFVLHGYKPKTAVKSSISGDTSTLTQGVQHAETRAFKSAGWMMAGPYLDHTKLQWLLASGQHDGHLPAGTLSLPVTSSGIPCRRRPLATSRELSADAIDDAVRELYYHDMEHFQ